MPLPNEDFTKYCCLIFNLNFLYRRVADIVQEIQAEKSSQRADVLTLNNAGQASLSVSFGGKEEEVDTLQWWSGRKGKPRKSDRMRTPLFSNATPNWIGQVIFVHGCF